MGVGLGRGLLGVGSPGSSWSWDNGRNSVGETGTRLHTRIQPVRPINPLPTTYTNHFNPLCPRKVGVHKGSATIYESIPLIRVQVNNVNVHVLIEHNLVNTHSRHHMLIPMLTVIRVLLVNSRPAKMKPPWVGIWLAALHVHLAR